MRTVTLILREYAAEAQLRDWLQQVEGVQLAESPDAGKPDLQKTNLVFSNHQPAFDSQDTFRREDL